MMIMVYPAGKTITFDTEFWVYQKTCDRWQDEGLANHIEDVLNGGNNMARYHRRPPRSRERFNFPTWVITPDESHNELGEVAP